MNQHSTTSTCAGRASMRRPVGTTWPGIQGDVLRRLAAVGRLIGYAADQTICEDGMPMPFGGVLLSGMIRIQRFGEDGRRQVMCLLLPGDFISEHGVHRPGFSMETASDVEILRIDRQVFARMEHEDADLRGLSYIQNLSKLERLRWMTWANARQSAADRYAAFLGLAIKMMPFQPLHDGSGVLSMILSRSDIADLLATTPETICRLNKKFERDGVLEMQGPAHLRLIDPASIVKKGDAEVESGAMLQTGFGPRDLAQLRDLAAQRHERPMEPACLH